MRPIFLEWGSLLKTVLQLPHRVGIAFTHAAVQDATDAVVDVLHIKGHAISPELMDHTQGTRGMDADILVRHAQVGLLFTTLEDIEWELYSDFEEGSSFEHAATLSHPRLASLDVHRRFPGISVHPDVAFDRLWQDRTTQTIAGITCTVPSVTAQRLILLLNTARGGSGHRDRGIAWDNATNEEKRAVRELARELDAEVALASAIGELDRWKHRREYAMWHYLSTGTGSAAQLWWARIKAERTVVASIRRGFRLVLPTPHRMDLAARRELSPRELAAAYWRRVKGFFQRRRR